MNKEYIFHKYPKYIQTIITIIPLNYLKCGMGLHIMLAFYKNISD